MIQDFKNMTAKKFSLYLTNEIQFHRDINQAVEKTSFTELRKVKCFIPFESDECFQIPKLDIESDPISLLVYENIRIELELLRKKVTSNTGHSLKEAMKDMDDYISVGGDFWEMLGSYLELRGKKGKYICERLKAEIDSIIELTMQRLTPFLDRAHLAHSQCYPAMAPEVPQIDRDIFVRATVANDWISNHVATSRDISSTGIKNISKSLIPLYSKYELMGRLRPNSPLFAKAFLDVDFLASYSFHNWEDIDIEIPPQVCRLLNKKGNLGATRALPVYEFIEPSETLNEVIISKQVKQDVMALCRSYKDNVVSGKIQSLTFLFRGLPGTGKTMMAKAIAKELGQQILRINISQASRKIIPQLVGMFTERARASEQLILFDECEDILSGNVFVGASDSWAKILFEEFKGVAVFTTNYDVPHAFERRITYTVDFKMPSAEVRNKILTREVQRLVEDKLIERLPESAIIEELTADCSISGGYYAKILQLAVAHSQTGELEPSALRSAFKHCEMSLNSKEIDSVRPAKVSLIQVQLETELKESVICFIKYANDLLNSETTRSPLLPQGAAAIFTGYPGTGKTITAEAIAKELGIPFRRVSPSTFLSAYVGETEKMIRKVFREAETEKYLLFIDEAEGLFLDRQSAVKSWEKTQVDEILQQVEQFKGVLVIATNHGEMIDQSFARRFLFHLKFKMPEVSTRVELWNTWKDLLGVDEKVINHLAQTFEVTGGEIRNIAVRSNATEKMSPLDIVNLCEETIASRTGSQLKKIGLGLGI